MKFQISLKYRLLNFGSTPGPHAPATLQITYTQRSLWDVGGPSGPFYDTSYMPEIFFQWLTSAREPATTPAGVSWLGLQSGLRHESNGRDGAASRSLNVAYVRPLFSIGTPQGWHVLLSPQLYAYIGGLSDNPDLPRYRGHMELRAAIGRGSAASLTVTVIPGEHFAHGSRQLDLTIPVRLSRMNEIRRPACLTGDLQATMACSAIVFVDRAIAAFDGRTATPGTMASQALLGDFRSGSACNGCGGLSRRH